MTKCSLVLPCEKNYDNFISLDFKKYNYVASILNGQVVKHLVYIVESGIGSSFNHLPSVLMMMT